MKADKAEISAKALIVNELRTVFFSCGSKPLALWKSYTKNGTISRLTDEDLNSLVLEILGMNCANCYIQIPCDPRESLGITKKVMVMLVKNIKKYFAFNFTVLDDKGVKRRFSISNYQRTLNIQSSITFMPMSLENGWNHVQIDLAGTTYHAFGTHYVEMVSLRVHANCRLRRIYFSDKQHRIEDLPNEYKLVVKGRVNS